MGGALAGFTMAITFVLAGFSFYIAANTSDTNGHAPAAWWLGGISILLAGLVAAGLFASRIQ